jgi:DNA-binding MarR family transcriptional regulator
LPRQASVTRQLADKELDAWRGFLIAHAELVRRLDAELVAGHGLSAAAYDALLFLHRAPEHRLRMTDLSRQVLFTPSGVSRLIDRLEREGLVRRLDGDADGRERLAELTDLGLERLRAAAVTHVAGIRRMFLDRFTPAELDQLAEFWKRLQPPE